MKKLNLFITFLILIFFSVLNPSSVCAQIETKIIASDGATGDLFGQSVSICGDYIVVGAWKAGSAYIFKREGSSWNEQAKLVGSGGGFGISVSICGDYVVVGAWGSAYIFKREGSSWNEQAKLIASDGAADDAFGVSVSINGEYVVVGAFRDDDNREDSGSAYIFKRNGTSWIEEVKLIASDGAEDDYFGVSCSINEDCLVVGAVGGGDNVDWSGSAYIFKRNGSSWVKEAKLIASDGAVYDYFGYSVSINSDHIVVGAYGDDDSGDGSGSAYIFKCDGASWSKQVKLIASDGAADDGFGWSVCISGDYVVVGALWDDVNGSSSGSAYIYLLNVSPQILSIKDVPNDQGGRVTVKWRASSLDNDVNTLPFYSIWRALPEGTLLKGSKVTPKDITKNFLGSAYRVASLNGRDYAWEWLANQPAHCFTKYAYTAETLYDSMSTTDGKHYFMVSAHTNDPNIFYDSNVDSGYSVDNLPPLPPTGFIASVISNTVELTWDESPEPDLRFYVIYRDGSRYDSTSQTQYVDANVQIGQSYSYKLTAVDVHENESKFSKEVNSGPVPVELTTFIASVNFLTITLTWETATETNNFGFVVERCTMGINNGLWQEIGFVKGHGTTAEPHCYQYVDKITNNQLTISTSYQYRLKQFDYDGSFSYSQAISVVLALPKNYQLLQNYPNPFNAETVIQYQLPTTGNVELIVYNVAGQKIRTLMNEQQDTGYHQIQWDGKNEEGMQIPSGVYLYQLRIDEFVQTKKMLMLK